MAATIWLLVVVLLIVAVRRTRRGRGRLGVGSAGVGAVYDMLNEDKRRAIEIVTEGRAEASDPEVKDGDLPQLTKPRRRR